MDITKPHVFNFDSRTFDKEPIFKIVKLKIKDRDNVLYDDLHEFEKEYEDIKF